MKNWSNRIKLRLQELGMTQEVLANKMGITRGAITHYLAGRRMPPLSQFEKLANILKVEPAWLQFGIENNSDSKNRELKIEKKLSINRSIPVLSWKDVAQFIDANKLKMDEVKEFIPHLYTDKQSWYGLKVKGDAMTSSLGGHHSSFIENDFIIVDPDKSAVHGDYVIALLTKSKEVTFKQYVIDGGVRYLKPLNLQYPIIEIDNKTHFFGVVVGIYKNI